MSQQQQRSQNATLSEAEQERLRGLVLYADRHVIAINKPAKLPVQGGLGVHRALTDWLHYLRDHPDTTTSHVTFHAGEGDSVATSHDGGSGAVNIATVSAAATTVRKARAASAALPHLPTIAGSAHSVRSFASMSGIGAGSGPFAAFADEGGGDGAKKRGGKKLSQSARLLQSLSDDELRLFSEGVLSKKKKRIAHRENMAAAASLRRRPAAGAAAAISLDEFGRPEGEVDATSTTAATGVVAKPSFARLSATAAVITSAAAATAAPVAALGASSSSTTARASAAAHAVVDLDSPAEDDRLEVPRLVHRLDAETSGVLLLARSRRAAQRFTDMFRTHAYEKVYWALTEGAPRPAQGTIDRALSILPSLPNQHGDDEQHQQHIGGDAVMADADLPTQSAVTAYRTLATANVNSSASAASSALVSACALLELRPKTGRKHQLRRHAVTDLQCPIVGDKKHAAAAALASDAHRDRRAAVYRALDVADPTLHLHARSIRFRHPFAGDEALPGDGAGAGRGGAIVEIVAPPPPHMLRSLRKLKLDTVIDL